MMLQLPAPQSRAFGILVATALVCAIAVPGLEAQPDNDQTSAQRVNAGASDDAQPSNDPTPEPDPPATGGSASVTVRGETSASDQNAEDAKDQPNQSEPGSVERVMEQLMQQRQDAPALQPQGSAQTRAQTQPRSRSQPQSRNQTSDIRQPGRNSRLDSALVGTAPDRQAPELLPEGTFIVNRRGRLIRSDQGRTLFSFDADDADSPETPMVMLRCLKLQDMEQYVKRHGDDTVFKVSGEVHVYRGANYLMPTLMVPEIDRGNLK